MKTLWMDLETSGRSSYKHGIIQAAFIVEIDGEVKQHKTYWMNPLNKEMDQKALDIVGVTEEDLQAYDLPPTVYKDIKDFFEEYIDPFDRTDKFVPAGYNVLRFDMGFLRSLWYDNNDRYFHSFFTGGAVDLIGVVRYLEWLGVVPKLQDDKLETVAKFCGCYDQARHHDAAADVVMARECAVFLREMIVRWVAKKGMPSTGTDTQSVGTLI